jgi:hypothetical protein
VIADVVYINLGLCTRGMLIVSGPTDMRPPTPFRFASEADYRVHQNKSYVQGLYKEYLPYITELFVFYPVDNSAARSVGGFDRREKTKSTIALHEG